MIKFLEKLSFKKLFSNNQFTIPFSIVLAFILWISIVINQKPTIERTISGISLNINQEDSKFAEDGMALIGDTAAQKFTVIVRGPSGVVSPLKSEDIGLYISVGEIVSPGVYERQVQVTKDTVNAEYDVVSITPSEVNINVDYIDSEEFIIKANAEGAVASEGLIAESGIVSGTESDKVKITGPRTIINQIDSVVATAVVNKTLSESETFDATSLKLYDVNGTEISSENLTLSLSKNDIKITVPVSRKKDVKVVPNFINIPDGFDINSLNITIDHPNVTIIGTPEKVLNTESITLSPIDLSALSVSATTFELSPKLPEGVRLLDNIEAFNVSLNLAGYVERTVTVEANKYDGLASSLNVTETTAIKNVKICGPRNVVNNISEDKIYALLDLTDKKAGEHTVDVLICFEGYNNVWAIGSYKTTVSIK